MFLILFWMKLKNNYFFVNNSFKIQSFKYF